MTDNEKMKTVARLAVKFTFGVVCIAVALLLVYALDLLFIVVDRMLVQIKRDVIAAEPEGGAGEVQVAGQTVVGVRVQDIGLVIRHR